MTKTERYMWLANDLLLTAAAVSLIINLVGQTASGLCLQWQSWTGNRTAL